jgi:hypothetical protein
MDSRKSHTLGCGRQQSSLEYEIISQQLTNPNKNNIYPAITSASSLNSLLITHRELLTARASGEIPPLSKRRVLHFNSRQHAHAPLLIIQNYSNDDDDELEERATLAVIKQDQRERERMRVFEASIKDKLIYLNKLLRPVALLRD